MYGTSIVEFVQRVYFSSWHYRLMFKLYLLNEKERRVSRVFRIQSARGILIKPRSRPLLGDFMKC